MENTAKTTYEFAYLLRPGVSEAGLKAILTSSGATILSEGQTQEISLSYPIKKSKAARFGYFHINLENPDALLEIDKKLKLEEDVLRFLVVKIPERKARPAREAKSPRRKASSQQDITSVTPQVSHLDALTNEKLEKTLEEILK